jgi:hypothetical protein
MYRYYSLTLKFIKMRKFLFFIMVLISINTYAQKVQFGFTTGLAIANYKSRVDGETESGKSKAGLMAGLLADIPVGKHFSFQPAVNYVQKGTKDEQTFAGITAKYKLNINCIEVPLNFLYNTRGKAGNFFVGAGPSFAVAFSGKGKYTDGTNSETTNLKFGSTDDDNMKGFDIGANFMTGFSLRNGIMFSLNYNAGLNNLFPHGSDDGTLKSHYFGIRLGYLLSSGRRK